MEPRRRLYAALSVLMQYPDHALVRITNDVRSMATELDADTAEDLQTFVDWLDRAELLQAQTHYVDLFDRKRRACLYLSYYLNGDTRRRGMAIVQFKELYRRSGWESSSAELPDFLPTLLQFGAVAGLEAADSVLSGHRAGLEVLHRALTDAKSPYARLTSALLRVVPVAGDHADQVMQLIETGPPTELVGLEPFAAPERIGV